MLKEILSELVNKILNEGFAWLSVVLGVVLILKYIVRNCVIKSKEHKKFFIKLNKYMRNTHIYMGVALIITGVIHGLFSSQPVFTLNLGTLCWISTILLGISWAIRKSLKKPGNWIKYHRVLTILFILTLGLHLIDIKVYSISRLINNRNARVEENIDNNSSENNNENNQSVNEIIGDLSNYNLKNGTYQGAAEGYGGPITVKITVNNNKVTDISIVSHSEVGENH